ncbi:DUF4374 domain-containing protein [Sphingobacterium bambusae]|uniref:DUF4374 domain-containing protein n=1 Tax=Sphingobacterium bambusae TaxID=662858 RepID=A0ABW6BES1_9SPHI|nr:DUF4374 domain-containing protein [Sphingobacterium bambusae]WPL47086.1 DUF4374 domain-containing protein [Sphingobacterium bambusae]
MASHTLKLKSLFRNGIYTALAIALVSCSDDPTPTQAGVYTLGLGVSTPDGTTNYVATTNDLMSGTITLVNNGFLQEGYRDYDNIGNHFQAIGGLGINDVNSYYVDANNQVAVKTGLNLQARPVDTRDVDGTGKSMLAVTLPADPKDGPEFTFMTIDVASNAISRTVKVPVSKTTFPIDDQWLLHTGIAIRGNKAFQTILPWDSQGWKTNKTDKTYVAVYSYPDFKLEKVIEDDRTGPAGAFGTRSGVFATESGDVYTISHSGFGYSKSTKAPAILKIASGATEFDKNYIFQTAEVAGGGRIVHAIYVGNNKLFASVGSGTQANQWDDKNLKFAIVDLAAKTITPVTGSPTFTGDGGRSFAAFHKNGKAYAAATVNNVLNIYEIDITNATIRKGAQVNATFVGGIGQIQQ